MDLSWKKNTSTTTLFFKSCLLGNRDKDLKFLSLPWLYSWNWHLFLEMFYELLCFVLVVYSKMKLDKKIKIIIKVYFYCYKIRWRSLWENGTKWMFSFYDIAFFCRLVSFQPFSTCRIFMISWATLTMFSALVRLMILSQTFAVIRGEHFPAFQSSRTVSFCYRLITFWPSKKTTTMRQLTP